MELGTLTIPDQLNSRGVRSTILGRRRKPNKLGFQLWTFAGGMYEPYHPDTGDVLDRRAVDTAVREPDEEGEMKLSPDDLVHQANIDFRIAGKPSWKVAVFVAKRKPGAELSFAPESESFDRLESFELNDIPYGQMAAGDRHWVPHIFAGRRFDAVVEYGEGLHEFKDMRMRTFTKGEPFPFPELPDRKSRWAPSRKAMVIEAIRSGLIPTETVQIRYGISDEELARWISSYDARGQAGLRVTRRWPEQ